MSYAQKVEGLSGLFEGLDDVAGAASGAPLEIALDAIEEDPNQPRTRFSERELDELAASIVGRGVRQAITVTPRGEGGRHRILVRGPPVSGGPARRSLNDSGRHPGAVAR